MRTRLVSLAWALLGGVTAFVLGCWLGAMLVLGISTWYPLKDEVTVALLDLVNGMSVVMGLWAGYWCQKLFLRGKLPDFGRRNHPG
jgi:hypothetical protein